MANEMKQKTFIRAAGRTLLGHASESNAEYICYVSYPDSTAIRGLYGLASGMAGSCRQDKASELAIEILKAKFEECIKSNHPDFSGALKSAFVRINEKLIEQNMELAENNGVMRASLVCGFIDRDDTAYLGYSGGGAVYLIEQGRISRLTRSVGAQNLDDLDPEWLEEGSMPAGWSSDHFRPSFISQKLERGSILAFCSEGLLSRIGNTTIQEILSRAPTVEEGVNELVESAGRTDGSSDVSAVVVRIESEAATAEPELEPEVVEDTRRSASLLAVKYIIVSTLIVLIGAGALFIPAVIAPRFRPFNDTGSRETEKTESSRKPVSTVIDTSAQRSSSRPATQGGRISIQTTPPGAKVFIDGVQEEQLTPTILELDKDSKIELRIEREGFEPYEEKMSISEGVQIERVIRLDTLSPRNGTLRVFCRPECEEIIFDGRTVAGSPKRQFILTEIAPGEYSVSARRGNDTRKEGVTIVPDLAQAVSFRFQDDKQLPVPVDNIAGDRAENISRGTEVEVVDTRAVDGNNEFIRTAPVPIGVPEENTTASNDREESREARPERAFFTVATNVEDCNIRVLKNGELILTGFSGMRMDVEPGRYTIVAEKSGYRDVQMDVTLDKNYQVVNMYLGR